TKLIVSPANAGRGKRISILVVGDSLTNATVYPTRLFELTQGEKNPRLKMIGSNGPTENRRKTASRMKDGAAGHGKPSSQKQRLMQRRIRNPGMCRAVFLWSRTVRASLIFRHTLISTTTAKLPISSRFSLE
ncbi:MAG: hypothetical protein V8T87_11085, partial [Victivallales bacterium]